MQALIKQRLCCSCGTLVCGRTGSKLRATRAPISATQHPTTSHAISCELHLCTRLFRRNVDEHAWMKRRDVWKGSLVGCYLSHPSMCAPCRDDREPWLSYMHMPRKLGIRMLVHSYLCSCHRQTDETQLSTVRVLQHCAGPDRSASMFQVSYCWPRIEPHVAICERNVFSGPSDMMWIRL